MAQRTKQHSISAQILDGGEQKRHSKKSDLESIPTFGTLMLASSSDYHAKNYVYNVPKAYRDRKGQ